MQDPTTEKVPEEKPTETEGKPFLELLLSFLRDLRIHMIITTVFSILTLVFSIFTGDYFLLSIGLFSWVGILGPVGLASNQLKTTKELLQAEARLCEHYKRSVLVNCTMAIGSIKVLGVMNLVVSAYLGYVLFYN